MEQEVNQYLTDLFTKIEDYALSLDEQKKVARDKFAFILDKIMRRRFRRFVSGDTKKSIEEKISTCVKENKPIHFVIPFGGYKHFWNPSHPEPDWAEMFNFCWMTEYVSPILVVHKPGVIIEYISEDMILPRMNNYPEEALEAYSDTFRKILDWYSKRTPNNLEFRYWRVGDKYDKQAIIDKVEVLLPERKEVFAKLNQEDQEQEIHRSLRSVYWNGKYDLTGLTEAEKRDRVIESRLIELAFYDTEGSDEFVGKYYWDDNRIAVCFSFGLSPDNDAFGDLTLQTALGSGVDFWIGRGVLRRDGEKLYGTVVSQQQYKNTMSNIKTLNVEPQLLPLKNYQNIELIEDKTS